MSGDYSTALFATIVGAVALFSVGVFTFTRSPETQSQICSQQVVDLTNYVTSHPDEVTDVDVDQYSSWTSANFDLGTKVFFIHADGDESTFKSYDTESLVDLREQLDAAAPVCRGAADGLVDALIEISTDRLEILERAQQARITKDVYDAITPK